MSNKLSETFVDRVVREVKAFGNLWRDHKRLAALVFIVGVVTIYLTFPDALPQIATSEVPIISDNTKNSTEAMKRNVDQFKNPNASLPPVEINDSAVAVRNGDLLVLQGNAITGKVVVELIHKEKCKASYRWRYRKAANEPVLNGEGEVFEQYGFADSPRHVMDVGGKLVIEAGPYHATWSCHTQKSGWIYRAPNFKVLVVPQTGFSDFIL